MTTTLSTHKMQRRDFLKAMGVGLASVWAVSASSAPLTNWVLAPSLATETAFGARLLRGTRNGQILQSQDQGQTWQILVSFGAHCPIHNLLTKNGQIYAQLAVSGYTFWLRSTDARTWHTLS